MMSTFRSSLRTLPLILVLLNVCVALRLQQPQKRQAVPANQGTLRCTGASTNVACTPLRVGSCVTKKT